jgi:Ca2+-binding RTX toxin-like protein
MLPPPRPCGGDKGVDVQRFSKAYKNGTPVTEAAVAGTAGNDVLTGTAGVDTLEGLGGNDLLQGLTGADTLRGGKGNDELRGGKGHDYLAAGDGDDILYGGQGHDEMYGSAGRDTFVFKDGDTGVGAGARDVIVGFNHDVDRIDLSAMDADVRTPGDQSFVFGDGVFAGKINFTRAGDHTVIRGDVNGDGGADFEIELAGTPQLTTSDFIL